MDLPAKAGWTRDRPAASGQVRRRSTAASASSSASKIALNDRTVRALLRIVPRGTISRDHDLNEGAPTAEVDVAVRELRQRIGGGQGEHPTPGPKQARAKLQPLRRSERRAGDGDVERLRAGCGDGLGQSLATFHADGDAVADSLLADRCPQERRLLGDRLDELDLQVGAQQRERNG